MEAINFEIYTDTGLAFQCDMNKIMSIEVLTGTWGGEDCRLGMSDRGGELFFHANETCTFQLENSNDRVMRLSYQGCLLSTLEQGFSYNGTFPDDTDVLIHWSWALEMPHETYFTFLLGLVGLGLMIGGILFDAYLIKVTPFFGFGNKEIIFEKESFVLGLCAIVIGFGLVVVWLLS